MYFNNYFEEHIRGDTWWGAGVGGGGGGWGGGDFGPTSRTG